MTCAVLFSDYDECSSGVSDCEHICTNVDGGYNCQCYPGFELLLDRRGCATGTDVVSSLIHVQALVKGAPIVHGLQYTAS